MKSAAPLASSTMVLNAVCATGRRGWPGGGHALAGVALSTIRNAETNPAKNMISVKTNSAVPSRALSAKRRRGGAPTRRSSVAIRAVFGLLLRLASVLGLSTGRVAHVVEAWALHPVLARALLHVGRDQSVEQNHDRQHHSEQPLHDRLLDVEVHEVLGDQVGLDQRHPKGRDQGHGADAEHRPGDAHHQQPGEDRPDLEVVPVRGAVRFRMRVHVSSAYLAMYSSGNRKIQTMSTKCQ